MGEHFFYREIQDKYKNFLTVDAKVHCFSQFSIEFPREGRVVLLGGSEDIQPISLNHALRQTKYFII